MKRIVLFFMFTIFSGSAVAEWILVGNDIEEGVRTYINKTNISKNVNKAKMWSVVDYESARYVDGKDQLSTKSLDEYDCQNGQYRTLAFYWYSRHKGEGELVYSETDPGRMLPIIPGSVGEIAWKAACDR
jgi:hypothetical protein